jgi:trehalose synthase
LPLITAIAQPASWRIASDQRAGPGIPLQVENGVSGYLVDNVEDCAARALEVLADPALGRQLGRAGKEHVRRNFLMPRLLRDWLRIMTALEA